MKWSQYSLDLFDAYLHTQDNLIVQACPGAGKTTNIEHLWNLDSTPTIYLVFTKANQEEAERKLKKKPYSAVRTLNSLGNSILCNNFGSVTLDKRKVIGIIQDHIKHEYGLSYAQRREREWQLAKAVVQCKQSSTQLTLTREDYQYILNLYDLESYEGMYHDVQEVLHISDAMTTVIDFADQIRLPALYDLAMPQYPTVLGDEVQDFSPIQARLVSKLGADRYVLVGDEHQSIYAFRGAMNDSMAYLRRHFNCVQMPLSITYRCAKAIVTEAALLYKDIEPWEQSPEGTVSYGWKDAEGMPISAPVYDNQTLIVCRINRPLITEAYRLLEQGIPCHVRGRDIGEGLANLVKKQQATDVGDLIDKLGMWYEVEMQAARIKEDEAHIQRIDDRYNSLMVFISRCSMADSPEIVLEAIASLFAQGRGVTLSTVHKAKGLEAERCYLLAHDLYNQAVMRARYPWQAVQERNIQYVAVTRAKRELVYC